MIGFSLSSGPYEAARNTGKRSPDIPNWLFWIFNGHIFRIV